MPGKKKASEAQKATRMGSRARGAARKQLRRQAQDEAAARNRMLRLRGELTPWQQAKYAARFRKGVGSKTFTPPARGTESSNISSIEKTGSADPAVTEAVRAAKPGSRAGIRAAKRGAQRD